MSDRLTMAPHVRDEITGRSLSPERPLVWRRSVPLVSDFELVQGEAVFGEMEPSGAEESDAAGECLGRSLGLRLDRRPFRRIRVATRVGEEGGPGPSFEGVVFGWGRVTAQGGESLRWRHALTRFYDHILFDSHGTEILRLRPSFFRFARKQTRVLVRPDAWGRPDIAELILLTWFLRAHSEAGGRRLFGKRHRGRERPWR